MSRSQLDGVLRAAQSLCFDSRQIERGCAFIAIRGVHSDGHAFVRQAVDQGAAALVVEDASVVPSDFKGPVAIVANARETLTWLASRFYKEPSKDLFTIGVTGTNGKTTTTYLIEALFKEAGRACGVIGTIDHHLGEHVWKTELTTPDAVSFQKRLREFVDLGAKAVALEASSHALSQARIDEVQFDVAVFMNLSRDHLDYHKDMQEYFQAKAKLFSSLLARSPKKHKVAIVNGMDQFAQTIKAPAGCELWRFGTSPACELQFEILSRGFTGSRFRLKLPAGGYHEFTITMPGLHNVENAAAAIGAALAAGVSPEVCAKALAAFVGVPGRLERVPTKKQVHVFVDFAHTDAALDGILTNIARLKVEAAQAGDASASHARILTVFGCGGDRDRGKRPLMMKAAIKGSDEVFLTSDNPRTEDPQAILDEVLTGASPGDLKKIHTEVDRRKAIAMALKAARAGDVVLIAGKGHEATQTIGTQKFPFSDAAVVKELDSCGL